MLQEGEGTGPADRGSDLVTRLHSMNAELQRLAALARPSPPGPPGERPMTFEEKRRLSMQIGEAHPRVLGEVMLVCSQDPSVAQVPCSSWSLHTTLNPRTWSSGRCRVYVALLGGLTAHVEATSGTTWYLGEC